MRSTKLLPIAAAAAMLSALAPAGASARPASPKHSSPSGPCRVFIEVPRGPITYGDPFSLSGHLSCPKGKEPGQELGNKQVMVYKRAAGAAGYALAGSTTTAADGAYAFPPPPFSTNSTFFVLVEGARSAHRTIRVAPLVSLTTPQEGTKLVTAGGHARTSTVFTGTVRPTPLEDPNLNHATVTVQQESSSGNEEWRRIGNPSQVQPNGTYSIPEVFHVPGAANLRVVVHPNSRLNATGASSPVPYVISQPQNPLLAINSSVDPLTYGESTSITGEVTQGMDKTPVTLMALTHGGHFTPVESGQTSGPSYSFKRMPLENTFYKVVSGTRTSSILVEGVQYAITLAPLTTTALTTSQPITLTGTVTGATAKHTVYLERKNLSSVGFHVADIAELSAPDPVTHVSTYTFPHAFRGAGEFEIRMKVPGDPGHLGKATKPIKITVTKASASMLAPELPAKLPPEGR